VRVFLEATSEANETVSGANSLYGQSSKEAMNGCRRDLEMVKKRFEIGRDGTGMCDDEDVNVMGEGGRAGGAGRVIRVKSNRRGGGWSRVGGRHVDNRSRRGRDR